MERIELTVRHSRCSFKGGLFDGEGKYVDLNNNVYVGHFVNGVRNGRGVMKYNDNVSEYDGCWVNNKRTGEISIQYFWFITARN